MENIVGMLEDAANMIATKTWTKDNIIETKGVFGPSPENFIQSGNA